MSAVQAFDTNFIIALTNPRPAERNKARLVIDPTVETVVPCIAYGEVWDGLTRGKPERTAQKRRLFELGILPLRVLWLDPETLLRFTDLCWSLARQGTPIPTNDIWIASLCLQHDAILITNDSDFKNVPGLHLRLW
jgi:predicted nucleic acid-binding protein